MSATLSDIDFTYVTLGSAPTEVAEYKAAFSETGTTATASIGNCFTSLSVTTPTVFPIMTASEPVSFVGNEPPRCHIPHVYFDGYVHCPDWLS